jgi:hypothetical protein
MIEAESYVLKEANPKSTITPAQRFRLDSLDWYIDTELPLVMQENKEYGILQAQWRHADRMNKFLFEGLPKSI